MTANVALKDLPEWNLADLYASPDAASFKTDMEKSVSDAAKFAMSYGGKLATLSGAELAKAMTAEKATAQTALGWRHISGHS